MNIYDVNGLIPFRPKQQLRRTIQRTSNLYTHLSLSPECSTFKVIS